jgi:hypothetical protein
MHMLRRLINQLILCAGLLVAGLPLSVCAQAMPIHDCCPSGPDKPCGEQDRSAVSIAPPASLCCDAGAQSPTAIIASAPSREVEKRAQRADPPILAPPAIAAAFTRSTRFSFGGRYISSFTPSLSTLYLSTLRLRL